MLFIILLYVVLLRFSGVIVCGGGWYFLCILSSLSLNTCTFSRLIISSSWFVIIMFPLLNSSIISFFSPSFVFSFISIILSPCFCVIVSIVELFKCFLRNMQKWGGKLWLSFLWFVRNIAVPLIILKYCLPVVGWYKCISSSFGSGWYIFSILAFLIV